MLMMVFKKYFKNHELTSFAAFRMQFPIYFLLFSLHKKSISPTLKKKELIILQIFFFQCMIEEICIDFLNLEGYVFGNHWSPVNFKSLFSVFYLVVSLKKCFHNRNFFKEDWTHTMTFCERIRNLINISLTCVFSE